MGILVGRGVKWNPFYLQGTPSCSSTQTDLHMSPPPGSPPRLALAEVIAFSCEHSLPAVDPAFMSFTMIAPLL